MAGDSSGERWIRAGITPGSSVAGYRLENRVGSGGMAEVYRAFDERLGRTIALKILSPALAGDAEFRERFIRESRTAAAVDHPHIIPVYAAGEVDGLLYIAMRFVSGGDLHSVLDREGPLSASRTAAFISPVASALDAAHAARLVHRDVKPANILVDTSPGRPDHPYLSDFGVSKDALSSVTLTGTGQFVGTPDFSAPEQISGKPANVQSDQYALACVAHTLLTGKMPFVRDTPMAVLFAHLYDAPPSVTASRPDLAAAVDQVLAQGMAKSPEERFGSCTEFADSLRAALGVGSYIPSALSPVLPPTSQTKRFEPTPAPSPAIPDTEEIATIPRLPAPGTLPHPGPYPPQDRSRGGWSRGRRAGVAAAIAGLAAVAAVAAFLLAKPSGPATPSASGTKSATPTQSTAATQSAAATPPPPSRWQARMLINPAAQFTGVSCPTTGSCLATDSGGDVYRYDGSTWSLHTSLAGAVLDGVSCASPDFCAFISTGTTAYIHDASGTNPSVLTAADGKQAHLTAVSCPVVGRCFATAHHNAYQYAAGAWSRGTNLNNGNAYFAALSCPTVSFCMAADNGGNVYTYNGSTWGLVKNLGTGIVLDGVSCAAADFCAVTSTGTAAYIYSGGTWRTSQLMGADGGPAHLKAVSCPSVGHCMAVGGLNTYAYTAGAWSRGTQVQNGHVFTSISCPTDSFCVTVNDAGSAYRYAAS
jgi:serine/threonine-protein kinase